MIDVLIDELQKSIDNMSEDRQKVIRNLSDSCEADDLLIAGLMQFLRMNQAYQATMPELKIPDSTPLFTAIIRESMSMDDRARMADAVCKEIIRGWANEN